MNKKLTPLEALYDLTDTYFIHNIIKEGYGFTRRTVKERERIIETALKENAELKQMIRNFNEAIGEPMIITPSIEKKLKALEIIKTRIKLGGLGEDTPRIWYPYIECDCVRNPLTKEEYDLLKEVLNEK